MLKYFSNYQNSKDLRKEYLKLIKMYHPDLAKDEDEAKRFHEMCTEINNEYEFICKMLPQTKVTKDDVYYDAYGYIINGNEEAGKACNEIADKLSKMVIDFNYYRVVEANWWEDLISNEINSAIEQFWSICYAKKIIGSEFAKLFELCGFDVEKMRRTIMFLSTGAISEKDIHTNLTSSNPIPFFEDNITLENLPNCNSFLLLSRDITKEETVDIWILFCQMQRDNFFERFYGTVIPSLPCGK